MAVISGLILALALPRGADASSLAIAQCGSLIVALAALVAFAARTAPQWPRLRDMLASVVATGAMVMAVRPLGQLAPGATTLLMQIGVGAFVYCGATLLFDIAGLRGLAVAVARPLLSRVLARARTAL